MAPPLPCSPINRSAPEPAKLSERTGRGMGWYTAPGATQLQGFFSPKVLTLQSAPSNPVVHNLWVRTSGVKQPFHKDHLQPSENTDL